MKYYAVLVGKVSGIYTSWEEAKEQIYKFPGAIYKSFVCLEDAQNFMNSANIPKEITDKRFVAYTDGSYVAKDNSCGYGIVLISLNNIQYNYYGKVTLEKKTNNVAELYAIYMLLSRISYIKNLKILIYTDSRYAICALTTPVTSSSKNLELIIDIKKLITPGVEFQHVKAHAGNELNEMADKLANLGRTSNEDYIKLLSTYQV